MRLKRNELLNICLNTIETLFRTGGLIAYSRGQIEFRPNRGGGNGYGETDVGGTVQDQSG